MEVKPLIDLILEALSKNDLTRDKSDVFEILKDDQNSLAYINRRLKDSAFEALNDENDLKPIYDRAKTRARHSVCNKVWKN